MNGVQTTIGRGWPATTVLRLAGDRPLKRQDPERVTGDELLLASIAHPPRTGQAQPIAALMPQVLAQYGLREADGNRPEVGVALDVIA